MVLVIEGGSVPVDVDVNVSDFNGVADDTGEVEGNIGSLDTWGWDVVGVVAVESEDTGIISALTVGDITGSLEVGDLALHKLFDEVGLGEVLWFEEWDGDTGFEDGHFSLVFLSFLIKNYNFLTQINLRIKISIIL